VVNQAVVKCQILQECFLQNFNMQKFQTFKHMEHSNSRTFQGLSRAWNFFPKFKDFEGLLKDPMNEPCQKYATWAPPCHQWSDAFQLQICQHPLRGRGSSTEPARELKLLLL